MRKTEKIRKLRKLEGEVPCFYSRVTIYNMCIAINELVGTVNDLADKYEELQKKYDDLFVKVKASET